MKGDEGGFVKTSMSILPIKRRTVLECRYPEKLSLPQHITTKHEMELHEELAKRKEENGSNTEASGGKTGTLALEERQVSQAAEFSSDPTMDEITAYLSEFEEKCPPGGGDSVVIYTTSLRGIWKTFEDCRSVKFLLDSFKVVYFERDVSMDLELREEMWTVLGDRVIPPRLFIRGRHIGGADEVVQLHEQGKLKRLLHGIPLASSDQTCSACAGISFVLCSACNGSRKIFRDQQDEGWGLFSRCPQCNENGLIKCPICCH